MQIVIDIDENVFTRLFDNGMEDYEIANDDLFTIAKSIRKGTPLDKIRAEIEKEIIPRNSDQYDREVMWQNMGLRMALKVIDQYRGENEEQE